MYFTGQAINKTKQSQQKLKVKGYDFTCSGESYSIRNDEYDKAGEIHNISNHSMNYWQNVPLLEFGWFNKEAENKDDDKQSNHNATSIRVKVRGCQSLPVIIV
jgi:hypothetical protein